MAETISEIDANRDLLCCRLKTWLQLLALSQRSILCHLGILLASVLPRTLAPSHPIFLPFPACFFLHLSGSGKKQGGTVKGTERRPKEGGRA